MPCHACDVGPPAVAQMVQSSGALKELKLFMRTWVQLPFMHSENLADQEECVRLYQELQRDAQAVEGGERAAEAAAMGVKYAQAHREVVAKWGRFPHRNAIVGRESTPEEVKGLEEGAIAAF